MSALMTALRDSFPSLQGRSPARWSAEELAAFATSPAATSGSLCAATFVLSVWSGPGPLQWTGDGEERRLEVDTWRWPWGIAPFDLHRALGCWDDAHRQAFQAWAAKPWWP